MQQTLKVLLVVDSEQDSLVIVEQLEKFGYEIIGRRVKSAQALQQALDECGWHLVLSDYSLSNIDAAEAVEILRRKSRDIPFIILSGSIGEDKAVDLLKSGADDFVIMGDWQRLQTAVENGLQKAYERYERRMAEQALRISEERFKDFANTAAHLFWEIDADLRFSHLSDRFENIFGVSQDDFLHKPFMEVLGKQEIDNAYLQKFIQSIEERRPFKDVEFFWVRPDGDKRVLRVSGKPIFANEWEFEGYRGTGQDVTEAHNLARQLTYQASHDAMTGLANRLLFEKRLVKAIDTAKNEHVEHALCYLDLDQFKLVNDSCGHVAGDELLRQLADLLSGLVRTRDTLARLGGDEFGVIMEHCDMAHAERKANELREAIEKHHFIWEEKHFNVGVSIGLIPINDASVDIAEVLGAADNACYAAKEKGRNRVHVYKPDDTSIVQRHGDMQWMARISHALEANEFEMYYQPIVSLNSASDNQAHYELLIRMRGQDGELIAPSGFLRAAERFNIAAEIDKWVIRNVFNWLSGPSACVKNLFLCAINLSGQSLGDERFLEFVKKMLDSLDQNIVEKICFEITETAAIANLTRATQFISALRERGCKFALDDFGSGLSSFAYLKNLPVDYLKIDGVFVKDIANNPIDMAMVKSINDIGHVMGKKTIAEFVENAEILEKLREIGVDYAQGYHLGRPASIHDIDLNDTITQSG